MTSANNRLKKVIDRFYSTHLEASKAFNCTNSYISHMISGKRPLNGEILNKIAICLPTVNVDWILHGRGEMIWSDYFTVEADYEEVKEPPLRYLSAGEDRVSDVTALTLEELTVLVLRLSERVRVLEGKVGE